MSEKRVNRPSESFPTMRLSIGIDFSKMDVINRPINNTAEENNKLKEEIQAELVNFTRTDRISRSTREKPVGTFISQKQLQNILRKNRKDRSYYTVLDYCRKYDKKTIELNEDFRLLRDFFPAALLAEVENYCIKVVPKIQQKVRNLGRLKLTPRKRRAYILAIIKTHCRRNGRRFPKELLEEINDRFNYTKRIKLFEVCKAEKELIEWNLLVKNTRREDEDIRIFYLNFINNLNRLKQQPIIATNEEDRAILSLIQKQISNFATKKEQKKALAKVIKHQDKDFAARLMIWVYAKYFAKKEFNRTLKEVEREPGWKELFIIENNQEQQGNNGISIRSFKFIFWATFQFRKKLREYNLFPAEVKNEKSERNSS